MNKTVRNERRKLTASWLNAIATALVAAGVFAPVASQIYGFGSNRADQTLVLASSSVCLAVSLILHFGWKAGSGRTRGMTQFQAIAILMPVFALVILVAFARWTQYLDRAPEDNPVQPKPAQRDR
jgi:hypothetical protein